MSETTTTPLQPANLEPSFIVAGGFGHDQIKNANTTDYVRSLGHTALEPLADPSMDKMPKGYTVRDINGEERTVPRQLTYLLAPQPEVTLISSKQQEKRAEELIAHIEEQDAGPVNGIFQSADAQNGLIAAHKRPDLFKNIVFAFPAGLVKKRSSTEYTRQMLRGAVRHRGDKHVPHSSDDFELLTRPRSIRERRSERKFAKSGGAVVATSVAVSYQNELLTEMRQREDAPSVSLVLGLKDSMMRPERVIESLNSANDVDCIHITNTKHGWNGSKKLMNDILELFPTMEAIKANRAAGQDVGPLAGRVTFAKDVSDIDRQRIIELVGQLDAKPALKSAHNKASSATAS